MKKWGWIVFLILGLMVLLFSVYNAVYIPSLDPAHPEQGWAWLTTDLEIIDYIKFNFRVQGMWQFAYGFLIIATAVGGFRNGARWAWIGLCSLPLVLVLMLMMMPWTLPVLILPLVAAIITLALSYGQLKTNPSAS